RTYTSIDDALIKCEHLLRNNEIIIAVDDVDQNIDVAKSLLGLEVGKSKIIFAGRKYISNVDTVAIKCTGFTAEESAKYVLQVAPNSDSVLRKEAIGKSKGNPLYLAYYCSRYDQEPADSIRSYHERIYNQLSAASQEILAVLSICEILLDLDEAATAVSQYRGSTLTAIELEKELSTIDFLVSVQNGTVAILHPAFREYVYNHLMNSGLAPSIHKAISEVYVEPYDFYFKAYHLVCAGEGDRIYDELPNAEIMAYQNGYVRIATKLFTEDILMAKSRNDLFRLGFAIYHTALVKKDRYGDLSGLRTATLAKKIFAKAQKPEWVRATESTIATFLVNLGRGYEAITMLKELVCHFRENGLIHQEAVVRTNLSYVYAKLGRVDELESECLKAKKLHESTGDMYGIAGCLLNLNNVYIARNENDKILSTCREIQKLASKLDSPRLEAGAQNGLTAYYRRKKMYDEAKKAAISSISIGKDLNAWDLIALNYGNLGNVFRDEENFSEAKKCHKKVEEIGRRIKSAYHVAHAKGRLAEIAEDEKDEKTALKFGEQSIGLWDEMGNVYEGASERCKLAERILRFAGFNWKDATNLYEEAINNYLSAGLLTDAYDSYQRLIDIELEHLRRSDAAETFHEGLAVFANPVDIHYVSGLLEGLRSWNSRSLSYLNLQKIASEISKCLSPTLEKSALFNLIRNAACTIKHLDTGAKESYELLIEQLVDQCKTKDALHHVTAIALALEQILITTDVAWTTSIFERISAIDEALVFRHEHWLGDRWYIRFNGPDAPIAQVDAGENISERVVAAIIALLILRQKQALEQLINKCGWRRIGWKAQTLLETECRQHSIPVPVFQKDFPVVVPIPVNDNVRDEIFTAILISDNYLSLSDHWKNPENKNALCVYLQIINELVKHFTRSSVSTRRLARFRKKTVTDTFDVRIKRHRR
ncbi:hypothetical protein KA005_64160, partial [bacterium]|nr:hypothetical protein [bacterium]